MALISVVVPVYYNAESLPTLLARLDAVARETPEAHFEWVFVDDGSGDGSFDVLQALARADERVRVLRLSRNFGSNAAILAGLTYCSGDCAVVISADLQDPPETIHELVAAWRDGGQVVLAARRTRDDPFVSRLLATGFNRLFRRLVFHEYPRDGFDFMLLDRRVVDVLVALQEKNSYIFGQAMWVGFRRRVVLYDRVARTHGVSRWTTAKKVKYFIDAFTAFSYVPLRAASILGMALASLGFLYAVAILLLRLTADFPVEGWASLSVILLVTSGTQLLMVGLLGEYLWRVLDETRRRPPFLVAETVNLDESAPAAAAHPVPAARE